MNRLKKLAEEFNVPQDTNSSEPTVEEAHGLVEQARAAVEGVVESYHQLFDALNTLAQQYPSLYDEMKMAIKFPNENDAEDISQMKGAFNDVADHFKDSQYLAGIIGVSKE